MAKNYYEILGVKTNATQEQIKSAYRRQVKKLHPDHYGEDQNPFLTVQEAYDTLSDPKRRNAYDSKLNRRSRARARNVNPEPLRPRQAPVEPLIPHDEPNDFERIFFNRPGRHVRSPFDKIFDHFWSRFDSSSVTPPRGREYFDVELRLTPEQVRRGGQVRLALPIELICPTCRGGGGAGFFVCPDCLGRGTISEEYPLFITFPAGIPHQHVETLPLNQTGLRGAYLRVHFNVDKNASL